MLISFNAYIQDWELISLKLSLKTVEFTLMLSSWLFDSMLTFSLDLLSSFGILYKLLLSSVMVLAGVLALNNQFSSTELSSSASNCHKYPKEPREKLIIGGTSLL